MRFCRGARISRLAQLALPDGPFRGRLHSPSREKALKGFFFGRTPACGRGSSPHFRDLFIIFSQVCGILGMDKERLSGIWRRRMQMRIRTDNRVIRAIVAVILFAVLLGIWAYLWVPAFAF
jgi:hypothetical protein